MSIPPNILQAILQKISLPLPILNMPFEGDAITALLDISGNENNGVNGGGAVWTPTGGHDGKGAFVFDGVLSGNSYLEVPDNQIFHLTEYISIVTWVKIDPPTPEEVAYFLVHGYYPLPSHLAWPRIVAKPNVTDSAPFTQYGLMLNSKGNARFELSIEGRTGEYGTQHVLDGEITLPFDQWIFLVATYDGINMKLYVDGVLDTSTPETGSITTNNLPISIGRSSYTVNPYNYFKGLIDDVLIYDAPLTSDQILALQ